MAVLQRWVSETLFSTEDVCAPKFAAQAQFSRVDIGKKFRRWIRAIEIPLELILELDWTNDNIEL